MYRIVFISIVFLALSHCGLKAQTLMPSKGNVEVVEDQQLTRLTDQYKKISLNNPETEGYRVQIFFDSGSNSKNKAANIKADFEAAYPDVKSYLSYKEPYYRVRVGDFRTLTEAVGFQKKIAADFQNSFAVKDNILQ